MTATAIAMHTKTGRIVPTAISPYLRHPMPMAMALASLDELAPGRVGVAVGVGNPLFLKEKGLAADKPLSAVSDYLAALRGLLTSHPDVVEEILRFLAEQYLKLTVELEGGADSQRLVWARAM